MCLFLARLGHRSRRIRSHTAKGDGGQKRETLDERDIQNTVSKNLFVSERGLFYSPNLPWIYHPLVSTSQVLGFQVLPEHTKPFHKDFPYFNISLFYKWNSKMDFLGEQEWAI